MKLSNIIPTHNRCDALGFHLRALHLQSMDPSTFEVIVVMDRCTDHTADLLLEAKGLVPYHLEILETPSHRHGVSAARNIGVEHAQSDLIAFTDDDIIPGNESFALFSLAMCQGHVLIGNMPCLIDPGGRKLGSSPHGYMDFVAQHVALTKSDFTAAGGFDEDLILYGAEDFDLGIRLLGNGCAFRFINGATCYDMDTPYTGDPKTREQKRAENAQNEALLRCKYGVWPYESPCRPAGAYPA